tara:strand:+ start:79 stop:186 length:108 start_codon:yes stop_codon:yes gene_type:complete
MEIKIFKYSSKVDKYEAITNIIEAKINLPIIVKII